jgi:hypothetical protein
MDEKLFRNRKVNRTLSMTKCSIYLLFTYCIIYDLFGDAVGSSDYITSIYTVINE